MAASQLGYFNNNLVPYRPMVGKMSTRAPFNAIAKVLRAIGCRALVSLKTGIWSSADGIGGSAGRAGVLVIEVSGTSFDLAHPAIRVGLCRSRARRSRLRLVPGHRLVTYFESFASSCSTFRTLPIASLQ